MFTMGLVHTRDSGLGCSVADIEPTVRQKRGRVLLYAHSGRRGNRGAIIPRGIPGGPQVEPRF